MEDAEQIVITGVSGRFPQCENVEEFKEALLKNVDLVKEDSGRFPAGIFGTPKRLGLIPTIDKFDASYFGIHPKQASYMDPRQRILLETVYEAIIDSGYNPSELRGSRTGVYVGIAAFNNMEVYRELDTDGYSNIGLSMALAANRTAYCFDFKGPSYALDTACSSSMVCFVNALNDLNSGLIDNAMICGTQVILHPHESLEFNRLNMLSPDGACKVFSSDRNGYARAETVAAIFLQRRKNSRRIYSTVLGGRANTDGFKEEGITFPSSSEQYNLMRVLYNNLNINPNDVMYIEAHGTGTTIGDIQECQAISNNFCQNRKGPLLIGAVKSNMGHAEMASGMCSLTKVIVAAETGIIPANLHVEKLDKTIPGICDNKLKVVTSNQKWKGGLTAVSSFGFGGANSHILLKTHDKEKMNTYQPPKHRLVQVSGRTEAAVLHFLDGVEDGQHDEDFLALVDEIHKADIPGHHYRGYTVLGERPHREVARSYTKRPIWFIYSGMGSQWNKMGRDLLKIDVFRNTINRCANALKPYGLDLINLITCDDPSLMDDITNCFCAIASIEIALTDVLYSLGIFPDGIAGHSLGEVGCAYGDGNITPEQAILLAYSRGYACQQVQIVPGQMAAIGLSKEEIQEIIPEDIFVACQNSKSSVTISGPEDSTKAFVEKLSSQGVFARLVKSGGIAFHTKYVKHAGKVLLEFCKNVLPDPKPRSSKWVSSSVPRGMVESWTQYNCAEYHYNNFSNPVLFDQVYEHIPENAIVIEVAPHGLLQAILKREMGPQTTHISLVNRSSEDNEQFLLSAIGKIYMAGGEPNLRKLYNKVSFPVPRGTKMLGPLMQWDHSVSWFTPYYQHNDAFGTQVSVSLSDQQYSYLDGHEIDGRVLMPATGYLELVWRLAAKMQMKEIEEFPIIMENIRFIRATILPYDEKVNFLINIMKQSGIFEIFESGSVVCSGVIRVPKDVAAEFIMNEQDKIPSNGHGLMKREDVYKECHLRNYKYKDFFQGIIETDVQGLHGKIEWKGKYCSFLDTMLHMTLISQTNRNLFLPTSIQKVIIDPITHKDLINKSEALEVTHNPYLNTIKSGGVEIIGLQSSKAPKRQNVQAAPFLETYEFIQYENTSSNQFDFDTSLRIALQIILQNYPNMTKYLNICEIITTTEKETLSEDIKTILDNQPFTEATYFSLEIDKLNSKYDAIVISKDVLSTVNIATIADNLTENGFILYQGNIDKIENNSLQIVYQAISEENSIYLLRPDVVFPENYAVINIRNSDFEWLEKLKTLAKSDQSKVVYLFSQEDTSGIIGLTKCLLAEAMNLKFISIFIDQETDIFSIDDEFYRDQLRKNLTFNVLKKNNWGTYVHLPMKDPEMRAVGNAAVTITTPGDLSTLTWIERPFEGISVFEKGEQVYVYYSGLNFKDVMEATGKLSVTGLEKIPMCPPISLGLEYSGVTTKGKRVMGMTGCESISLQIQSDPYFQWEIPQHWTLRDAASIPCVYATCYYGMILRGKLQPGEAILIHAGTGGIGIAAINIALSMNCTVYSTVSTKEKREFLKKMFPQLDDKNIGNSRNASFEKMIKINTKGKGVNMVINSLADELFQASIRCLAPRGRFIEIGKMDLMNSSRIPSTIFLNNIAFHGVHLDKFFYPQCESKKEIRDLLTEGIANGVVKPLPTVVFDETQIEAAFRFLAGGKHKGKVLIEIRKEDLIPPTSPVRSISAVPSVYCNPRKSYVLVGGLGGFGLELADWLIHRGATKIILNSRRGLTNGYQAACLRKWTIYKDVVIQINTNNTSDIKGAESLINFANSIAPVGGIFNMALVLKDASLVNQTREGFEEVFKTKIISGQNLDTVSRRLCKDLDHFVVFSSVACGRGNAGQSNYGMANSALERLCEKRKRDNLPGLAVQWGPIGDVGALINMGVEDKVFKNMKAQRILSCLNALEKFMLQPYVVGSSIVLENDKDVSSCQTTRTPVEAVAHILGINNIDLVDKTLTLLQLGLDSLMTTEIKQTLYRNFQMELSQEQIRDLTLNALISMGAEDVKESTITKAKPSKTEVFNINYLLSDVVIKMNITDMSKRNIFILHPIEGRVDILKTVASKLKTNVYGLQSTNETLAEQMDELAQYYIKKVKEIQPQGPYSICGYSFGCALAIEMSMQLENAGESVDLIMIDGSPIFVQSLIKNSYMRMDESMEKSKAAILETFAASFESVNQEEVANIIRNSTQWEEQLESVSKVISNTTKIDEAKILASVKSYYRRIHAIYYYYPTNTFGGRILLIRREDNPFFLSENYELQKICKQPVGIVKLKGNHSTILLGENAKKVADIINRFYEL